jgi:hypothetical protein
MKLTIYRDRRNEKPCKHDDPFSVPVTVEVGCQIIPYSLCLVLPKEYDIRATVTENVDPYTFGIPEIHGGNFTFTRCLFKKGEEIDLTPEERNTVIEAYESRSQD